MFDFREDRRRQGWPDASTASVVPDQVHRQFQAFASTDFKGADEQMLCDSVTDLENLRRLLDAAECHVLAELDSRSVTDRVFGLRTAQWLAARSGLPTGVARARVGTARKLATDLPDVDKYLTRAEIGFEHAKALADATNPRIVDLMAAASDELCREARNMLFHPWHRQVRSLSELLDQDGGYDPDADLARNRLRLSGTGGNIAIKGELVGQHAVIAEEALNSIADELFQKYSRDNLACPELKIPDRATLLALALVEACRRGIATPVASSKAPRPEASLILTPDTSHPTAQCAGCGSDGDQPHPTWVATINQGRTWSNSRDFAGMAVYDSHGVLLNQRTWRTLLCDPDMSTLIVNSLGVPLDSGRQLRFASRQQKRALAARDGGCVFPGCTSPPSWTDSHHIIHWEHGGKSDLTNLISLCRHHHGVAHRRGWAVSLDADGWSTWTSPSGGSFPGQRHQQLRQRTPP